MAQVAYLTWMTRIGSRRDVRSRPRGLRQALRRSAWDGLARTSDCYDVLRAAKKSAGRTKAKTAWRTMKINIVIIRCRCGDNKPYDAVTLDRVLTRLWRNNNDNINSCNSLKKTRRNSDNNVVFTSGPLALPKSGD